MEKRDNEILEYIYQWIEAQKKVIMNSYYYRNSVKAKVAAEQKLLDDVEIFDMITFPVLEKLLEKKYALKWNRIADLKCLTEEFIQDNFKGLSPTKILNNYPDLSQETRELFYPYIGIYSRLEMRIKMDQVEEDIIAGYSKYGKKLKKKLVTYIAKHKDELPESLILFIRLVD